MIFSKILLHTPIDKQYTKIKTDTGIILDKLIIKD